MSKRILVTGGSGFIGGSIVGRLIADGGYEILNIDSAAPHANQLKYWKKLDILDNALLHHTISVFRPDLVLHFAARTDLRGASVGDYAVNSEGTENLINACNQTGSVKKIIFASSMLVNKVGYTPASDIDYNPSHPYGHSKVEMEKMIRAANHPWDWTIVRPTSIWGPGFGEPYRNFFETVKAGRFVDIGTRYCRKTYGYIGNTVYQLMSILKDSNTNKKTYYLGDEPPIFISDWAKEVARAWGRKAPPKIPYPVVKMAAVVGDGFNTFNVRLPMNSFRLKNMTTDNIVDLSAIYQLAPHPPYSREQGIEETVRWLRQQNANN